MKTIGITGGIGSGKTMVSRILETLSYPVYNADLHAKRLMNASPFLIRSLTEVLGKEIYRDGQLDRPLMARLIFNDQALLQRVNSLVHPAVKDDFRQWCSRQRTSLLFLESAILFESGFDDTVDRIWVVTAPESVRIARVVSRDRISEAQVKARIDAQMKEEEKISLADVVIINDGNTPLLPQVVKAAEEADLNLH